MAKFTDTVTGIGATTAAVANKVQVGTLTLSQSARSIDKIWASAVTTTGAAADPLAGYIIVTSDDCNIAPCELPIEPIGPALGTASTQTAVFPPHQWIINCPCPGGAKLIFNAVQDGNDMGVAPEIIITVEYSDKGPTGAQRFYDCAEPAGATGTTTDTRSGLTNVSITSVKRVLGFIFYATSITDAADEAVQGEFDFQCNDFQDAGPHKLGINASPTHDNTAGSHIIPGLTVWMGDIEIKGAPSNITVSAWYTNRDQLAAAGFANYCVIFIK